MGAVFGTLLVAVALVLVLAAGMAPVLLIPVVLIAAALIAVPLVAAARNARIASGPGESGVPTTREASYDPRVGPR